MLTNLFLRLNNYIIIVLLLLIPLYPKFPLVGVGGTFVAIRLEDFVIACVVAYWLVYKIVLKDIKFNQITQKAIILYWLAGFVATFSAIVLSKLVSPSIGILHTLRRIEYMIMFFIGFDLITNSKQIVKVIQIFLLSSFLVGIYGIGQQWYGLPVISTTNSEFAKGLALTLGQGARINSTFAGHYDLAAFCIFPLLLIIGLLVLKIKYKPALIVIGIPIYMSMILSASRVTFAGFFVTATLFLIALRKKVWIIPLYILMIISFILSPQLIGRYREFIINHLSVVPTVHAETDEPVSDTADALKPSIIAEDRSFNIRLQSEWPRALRSLEKNPLIGTGYSSIGLASDNDYLRSLAETGVLGFVSFMLVFLTLLKPVIRLIKIKNHSIASVFSMSILFGLIGLLINATFIDVFEASKIAILTWLLTGIVMKTVQLEKI